MWQKRALKLQKFMEKILSVSSPLEQKWNVAPRINDEFALGLEANQGT